MSAIDFISLLKEVKKFQSDPKVIAEMNKLLNKVTQDTSKATLKEIYDILNEAPKPDQLKLLSDEAKKYAEQRSGNLILGIDETTSERFRELFSSALEEGMSAQQFADSLTESGLFDEDRAILISRTETAFAHNEAAMLSYNNSEGVVVGKEWLVANDACDICESIGTESIPLDAMFQSEDGEEYLSPPAHPNCRCTTTATLDIPFETQAESTNTTNASEVMGDVNTINEPSLDQQSPEVVNYTIEYHGTNMGDMIEKEGFKLGKVVNGRMLGNGVYTTSNYEVAQYYAIKSVEETGKGIPVVLQVRVPLAGKDNYFANYEGLIEFVMKARAEREGVNFYGLVDSVLDGIRARSGNLPFDVTSIYERINAGKITNLEGVKQIWEKNKNEILDQYFKLNRNDFLSGKAVTESMRYKNVDNFSLFQWETTKKLTSSVTVTLDPTKVIVTKNRGQIRKSKRYTIAYTWGVLPEQAKAESSELQKAETYKPTEAMAEEAKRALKWKAEGNAGGTRVGLARANQLAKRENLSESTVKRMFSFFSRHEVDKQGKGFYPGEGYPSKGRVAWALWGGDAGFSWSRTIVERLKEKG